MTEKTKKYLKEMGIVYLLAIAALIFKVCKNNKTNVFYTLTADTLVNGTFDIYDDNINKVGKISYENNGNQLIVSIKGDAINGKREIIDEEYHYDAIEYENIPMTMQKYENEFYYFYDTGESVVLLCLLRPWFTSYSPLQKLSKKRNKYGQMKDRQTFMFINIDYESYQFAFDYPHPTIQNHFTAEGGNGQLYRCFFIQEEEL